MSLVTNLELATIMDRIIVTFDPVTRGQSYSVSNGVDSLTLTDADMVGGKIQGTFTGLNLNTNYAIEVVANVLQEDGTTTAGEAASNSILTAGTYFFAENIQVIFLKYFLPLYYALLLYL